MKTQIAIGALMALLSSPAAAQCALPTGAPLSPAVDGEAVDISGDTAVVGAPTVTPRGAAYVHERDAGGPGAWGRVAELVPTDGETNDFGFAVAVHGDRAVVGDPVHGSQVLGAVYVFERHAGGADQWGQVARLDPNLSESFGFSVDLWGDTVVVGAPEAAFNVSGAAFLFERNSAGRWTPTLRFLAPVPGLFDSFGFDVAIQGDRIAVSEPQDGLGWFPGSVFIYERDFGGPNAWGKVRRIRSSDKANGDWFGQSIGLDGDTIVIGALNHDHGGLEDSGAAYVFERDLGGPDNWGERAELLPGVLAPGVHFGLAVAHDGDTALVSDHVPLSARAVYAFERHSGGPDVWAEAGALLGGVASLNGFGHALALQGTTAVVCDAEAGETLVYELGSTQPFTRYCTAGTSASGCRPTLSACGVSSAAAPSGFLLRANGVEGGAEGLFFYAANGRQAAPWGNGTSFQCVAPPVLRGGPMGGAGNAGACDGSFALDLNARWCPACPKPHHNPGAGTVVQAQLWYRDPQSTSNRTTSLSDAIEFRVQP